ncbi:glycosyl hydrolase [Longitalea luteola]|uniref:glycosyl hydrolase n=1 Tax=Longitalea luteola TaxID=2812563 RepID=UPI001A956E2D|nr:glycosyl hydrolase [Longitalea luteola]
MKKTLVACYVMLLTNVLPAQTKWPAINQQTKPWTRWWWMGSAVDEKNSSSSLQQMNRIGFGGVEIVPIYGAKGYENRYVKYLSPQWMKMLDHTVQQSNALNMGVYISVGSGWPIGGTHVTIQDAASKLFVQQYELKANTPLAEKISIKDPKQQGFATLSALMGFNKAGKAIDLTNKVDASGTLQYNTSEELQLYALFTGKTRQAVKRAAPGGEGYTIDHFSTAATANYFKIFDTAFGNSSHGVKAFFNDSYEVYNADWTPDFFNEFLKRRGYDLRLHINQFLAADSTNDATARLKSDYRETLSDLMRENFSNVFTKWTNNRNTLSVNQAHGSPGNLLDLYGAFDIPETETFGSSYFPIRGLRRDSGDIRNVDPDPNMLKFASSAAHAYGKPLTSCETFTWLTEHFKTSWSQCKPEVDQVFLSGINHVFYHGTTYSPDDAKWPGWLFYASVNFVPNNSLWPHLKGLNDYIARCQAVLQAGEPDNEILLYWPVYDAWHHAKGMDMPLKVHDVDEWLHPTNFYKQVVSLQKAGYSLDFASDRMLAQAGTKNGIISVHDKGAKHKVLLVPACEKMPVTTFSNILRLAKEGAAVIIEQFPKDVPGYHDLEKRRQELKALITALKMAETKPQPQIVSVGKGKLIVGNVTSALNYLKVAPEPMAAGNLKFIRRQTAEGKYYFIVNNTAKDIDETLTLQAPARAVLRMDPLNGDIHLLPHTQKANGTALRLQLRSGESVIVKLSSKAEQAPAYKYLTPAGASIDLQNNRWTLEFKAGGPQLPAARQLNAVQPWTGLTSDSATQSFSGTGVYTTTFTIKNKAADYLLQLDKLYESARIIINGKDAGLIWSLPYEMRLGRYLKAGKNTISIEVNNLMANRIRDMDRKGEVWRNYHEINFVNINYKNFDASTWKVQPSGLGGSVKLVPLQ